MLQIKSTDHTDFTIVIDKILYVSEKKNGCAIMLDNGVVVSSGAKYKDVATAMEKALAEMVGERE